MRTLTALEPGPRLLRQVRAGFVLVDTSLSAWCRRHATNHAHAHRVLMGERNGPAARELRQRLAIAAGLLTPAGAIRQASIVETSEAA